jgi:hypothetical protein
MSLGGNTTYWTHDRHTQSRRPRRRCRFPLQPIPPAKAYALHGPYACLNSPEDFTPPTQNIH